MPDIYGAKHSAQDHFSFAYPCREVIRANGAGNVCFSTGFAALACVSSVVNGCREEVGLVSEERLHPRT